MNLSLFISNRLSKDFEGGFSATIRRIAIISIALGLAVLMVAFMVLFGFEDEIKSKIYGFSGHIIIDKYSLSTSYEETSIVVTDSLVQQLKNYPLTDRFQVYAMKAGLVKFIGKNGEKIDSEIQGVIFKGVDSLFNTDYFDRHMVEGRFPNFSGGGYSTEVVFSKKIANYLNVDTGDEALIYFVQNPPRYRKLKVVGIYETGLEGFDEKIIIGDLGLLRRINNWPDSLAGGIELFINDIDELDRAEFDLFNSLDIDLYVDKVTDKYVQIFDWLNLLNKNVLILLAIILFVTSTSIISIVLILIMERTRMIGLLKALGATNKLIRSIFIWNGIRFTTKGLIWGNGLGLTFGIIQAYFKVIPLEGSTYYMDHVPIIIDIPTILELNLLVLSIVSLTLLIPVSIVSKVRPVRTIQFH